MHTFFPSISTSHENILSLCFLKVKWWINLLRRNYERHQPLEYIQKYSRVRVSSTAMLIQVLLPLCWFVHIILYYITGVVWSVPLWWETSTTTSGSFVGGLSLLKNQQQVNLRRSLHMSKKFERNLEALKLNII